jgi:hypothetical protein
MADQKTTATGSGANGSSSPNILEVRGLKTYFYT